MVSMSEGRINTEVNADRELLFGHALTCMVADLDPTINFFCEMFSVSVMIRIISGRGNGIA
jgi:hypothetical protein